MVKTLLGPRSPKGEDRPGSVPSAQGSMVVGTREEIIAAQDAWRDAKRAYDDEAAQFVGGAWLPTVPPPAAMEGMTREACEKLTQLSDAEHAAAAAFCAAFQEN